MKELKRTFSFRTVEKDFRSLIENQKIIFENSKSGIKIFVPKLKLYSVVGIISNEL